jgi:hypothetical protein
MKAYWGVEVKLHSFFDLGTRWGEWSASRPGRFTPRERAPGTHWIGGWVGPTAVLDAVVKRKIPSPLRESNPRTPIVQPVAQRYTDWAITACRRWYIFYFDVLPNAFWIVHFISFNCVQFYVYSSTAYFPNVYTTTLYM